MSTQNKNQNQNDGAPDLACGREKLFSRSFIGLLITQFTVALNDNIFRWLLIPIGKARLGNLFNNYDQGAGLAIAVGGLAFLLPFVLFSGYGGYFADRYSKRRVMIWCKVAEIFIMVAGVAAIYWGNLYFLTLVLFAMGTQSTFYSPSKYSSIPEIVPESRVSVANGLVGMSTMVAIILGTVLGGFLYKMTTAVAPGETLDMALNPGTHQLWISASVLIGVATFGWLTSLLIQKLPEGSPEVKCPMNPLAQSMRDVKYLRVHPALLLVALGSAFYWGLGALAQSHIDRFTVPELLGNNGQPLVGVFLAVLTLGIGVGSFIAGFVAGGKKVRLHTVPIALFGIAFSCLLLFFTPTGIGSGAQVDNMSYLLSSASLWANGSLFLLGVMAGMLDIPLMIYLQKNGEEAQRGRIIAASNFLSFIAMLIGIGMFYLLNVFFITRGVWLALGVSCVLVGVIAWVFVFLKTSTRILVKLFLHLFYRIEIQGAENVPTDGPFVIECNHTSYLDGLVMRFCVPYGNRKPRIMYWAQFDKVPFLHKLAEIYDGIPVEAGRTGVYAIRAAREALDNGEVVGIFPEGTITRHHVLMPFKPGIRHILKGRPEVPVVPMYIGGLFGSIFSFKDSRFFWKKPERFAWKYLLHLKFRRHVVVKFGEPIYDLCGKDVRAAVDAVRVLEHDYIKDSIMKKGSDSDNFDIDWTPVRSVIRHWKTTTKNRLSIADSTGIELKGKDCLLQTLILRRLLRKHVLEKGEENVGILIPPCVPSVLVNIAVTVDQRAVVNLNYTVSNEIMNLCIKKAHLKHVLTSRKVLEKLHFEMDTNVVFLEDLAKKLTLWDKLVCLAQSHLPLKLLYRTLGLHKLDVDDTMTIIFTSGSTGIPKGVMLSHKNIGGNIACYSDFFHIGPDEPGKKGDSAIGVLPFFHSFGYTGMFWTVLTRGMQGYYHTSPLECRQIAKLCRKYRPTMLVGTPTFLRLYARQMEPDDLSSVNLVVSGAERCPVALMDEYERKFGIRPIQGYGLTETSPVVAANIPASRHFSGDEPMPKDESIGFPMPGVSVKILNLETGEPCKTGEVGMLWASGINVMKGYYEDPQKTTEVIQDGWYCTGDLVYQDADNFLFIAGRLSRFAKIGGEMVPHEGIEEAINLACGYSLEQEPKLCVASVADEKKGERLVVLYTELPMEPREINAKLVEQKLPTLWIPGIDCYHKIPEIPLLGTGKLDLFAINQLAKQFEG